MVADEKLGWLIGCKYRGKNAYGGLILTAGMFVISHEQVVDQMAITVSKIGKMPVQQ